METRNKDIRFFMGSSSEDVVDPAAQFYQAIVRNLIRGMLAESQIAYLIAVLEQARSERKFEIVDALAGVLIEARISTSVQGVGLYFKGLALTNQGKLVEAHSILDRAAATAAAPFSSRALISIGAVAALSSEPEIQRESYIRASRSTDPFTLLHAHKMIAVLESGDGNHRASIQQLEGMFSFARSYSAFYPHSYYDYLNSLAFEMAEVGRLDEARQVSQTVLASPLARLYPECHETRAEIELRRQRGSRSVVSIRPLQETNVLEFRMRGDQHKPARSRTGFGALLNFPEKAMAKKKESKGLSAMSTQEKQKEAIRLLLYDDDTDEEAVDAVLKVLRLSKADRKRLERALEQMSSDESTR
jgi:tetratricopeptide (TPR) repeat protein